MAISFAQPTTFRPPPARPSTSDNMRHKVGQKKWAEWGGNTVQVFGIVIAWLLSTADGNRSASRAGRPAVNEIYGSEFMTPIGWQLQLTITESGLPGWQICHLSASTQPQALHFPCAPPCSSAPLLHGDNDNVWLNKFSFMTLETRQRAVVKCQLWVGATCCYYCYGLVSLPS
uniref:HDC03900 n=1 Tax=Drosophila melanogaster TaxID=7227 RepID=Q6IH05_DROME|nr:TPA_inf: HDC03900 [Drosophila melanogaster]